MKLWRPDLRIMTIQYVLDGRRVAVSFRGGMFRGLCDIKVRAQDENEECRVLGLRDAKIEYTSPDLWYKIKEVAKVNWMRLCRSINRRKRRGWRSGR